MALDAQFAKMNGLGNKILVVDMRGRADRVTPAAAIALAGGAETQFDQIMAVYDPKAEGTDAWIDIINCDGTFAQACFGKMANYPTAYCTEAEVAEAVFSAATEDGGAIRYPAGPDTKLLADLRWSTSEEHYLTAMRRMFGVGASA